MFCVEFPQVQYIDLNQIVHVLKAVAMVNTEDLHLSTIFVDSYVLSAMVFPEWRLNQGFGTQKSVFFPWICPFNRSNKYKDFVNILRDQICVPWMVASLE